MVRLEDILDKVSGYNPQANLDLIKKAYVFSGMVHKGQQRLSGQPYLSHPIEVAEILTSLHMDTPTVATGLLHDTVEDTYTTVEKIEEVFGSEISGLVDGLTKLSRMTFERREDREAENFRKMILAMAKDIRVILVKLADRLHNMRTLEAHSLEKQRKIARETLDIYAPLANRLGIGWMKAELEDLAFKYLWPEKFNELNEMVDKLGIERESYMASVKEQIEQRLKDGGLEGVVSGRPKHLYSIYKKMREQDLDFDKIHDVIGFRIVATSVRNCYVMLGIMHSMWKPVPGRFKDYIGMPKPNRYQSLHTTVIGPFGERMEVQFRTEEMHTVAEYGIASHWKYKEGAAIEEGKDEKGFPWLKQLVEWQTDLTDPEEFMETVKVDLFPEEVFVFTPQGNVKVLPAGATPVDFAYSIHTDIGQRCAGAKVDGKTEPLNRRLRNGNVIEIVTSQSNHPTAAWLDFVVTSKAKTKIRHWLRSEEREKSIALGKEICSMELKNYGLSYGGLLDAGRDKSGGDKGVRPEGC